MQSKYDTKDLCSVADPGCLSRIPDPDQTIFWYPGSRIRIRPSFIPDPGSRSRILGGKKVPDPGSRIRIRNTEIDGSTAAKTQILHTKKCHWIFRKKFVSEQICCGQKFYMKCPTICLFVSWYSNILIGEHIIVNSLTR
jgi:hypothetical protein